MTYGDNESGSAFAAAVDWIRDALLGAAATSAAVVAVAVVGMLMLSGRVPIRRGATVVLGCFVLFSAATIAQGLAGVEEGEVEPTPEIAPPAYTPSAPTPQAYDPYAGASVPIQRSPPSRILQ